MTARHDDERHSANLPELLPSYYDSVWVQWFLNDRDKNLPGFVTVVLFSGLNAGFEDLRYNFRRFFVTVVRWGVLCGDQRCYRPLIVLAGRQCFLRRPGAGCFCNILIINGVQKADVIGPLF